jgi:hypothetical protein
MLSAADALRQAADLLGDATGVLFMHRRGFAASANYGCNDFSYS